MMTNTKKQPRLIEDKYFKVEIDDNSRQQDPDMSIWNAMHCTVDGGNTAIKKPGNAVNAVINNALKFGHWSVLEHASVKLNFYGFPHDTAMQFRTHQRMATLVQSLRYASELYTQCADGEIEAEELFYLGASSSLQEQVAKYAKARSSCINYALAIKQGEKRESARRYLMAGYRQNFTMSGTFRQWMHALDQRLLADTQVEAQTAAWMALDQLCEYSDLFKWYRETRAGKNMLAP